MARVAVNGLGRIGRATLKIVMDTPGLDLVAANDMGAPNSIAYLLNYDTVYGRYEKTVETTNDGTLTIGQHPLTLLREENPARLPWRALNVDIVFECTGAFTRRQDLAAHIRAGARYVILWHPRKATGMKLGKFATSTERISVRVTDMNGPRGGVDQLCNVKVVLSGLPSVVVERRHAALHAAIDDALRATERAVRRSVGRRRMKPLRGRNSMTGGISAG